VTQFSGAFSTAFEPPPPIIEPPPLPVTAPASLTDQPCEPWAAIEDATDCVGCAAIPSGALDDALQVASTWLWRLTGKVYGSCAVTVLPIGASVCDPCEGPGYYFDRARNCWMPPAVRGWRPGRGEGANEIRLGYANVRSVDEVTVDGVTLEPWRYRIDDGRWLVRCDGEPWPVNLDTCAVPPRLAVTLHHGLPVPPDGVRACAALACEIARACAGDKECRLPRRVQSITRQGVSMVLLDPLTIIAENKFGLPEVDYFIQSVNPRRLDRRAAVVSPDVPRQVRVPTSVTQ
jgi:hypothetical protein